ncbi:hypothetical protein [Clostridium thermobutyricum]|nr:hypothetical protein [Clostridium thermobutyricum]
MYFKNKKYCYNCLARTKEKEMDKMEIQNAQEILELIPDLQRLENPQDFNLIKGAISSCLTVQELKKSTAQKTN